jgi:hypothetical protein
MVIGLVVPVPVRVMSLDAQAEKSLDRLAEICLPTAANQLNNVLQGTAQSTGVARTNIPPKGSWTQVMDETASSPPGASGHCLLSTLERDNPHRQGQETRPADQDKPEKTVALPPLSTSARGRKRWNSLTYPPTSGSKYSVCWSRITACGTGDWAPSPRRHIA